MTDTAKTTTKSRDELLERGAMAMNAVLKTMGQSGREIVTAVDFEAFTGIFGVMNALSRAPSSALVVADGFAAGQQSADRIDKISQVANLMDGVEREVAATAATAAEAARAAKSPANDADKAPADRAA